MDGVWDGAGDTSPAAQTSGSLFDKLSDALGGVVQSAGQRAQRELAQDVFSGPSTNPKLGVNQDGKPFAAGKPTFLSGSVAGVPAPLVLVGVGIVALALILHGK